MNHSLTLSSHLNDDQKIFSCGRHFLLMDCALDNRLIEQYFDLDEEPEYSPILSDNEDLLLVSPYLVEIKDSTKPFIEWFNHHSDQWGFFFYSDGSLDDVLEHWKSLIEVTTPEHDALMLRFSDGSVAQKLWACFNDEEKALFFKPCKSIHFQANNKEWQRHVIPALEVAPQNTSVSPWFNINEFVYRSLTENPDSVFKEKLIDTLWAHYPDKLETLPEQIINGIIDQGIETARSFQIQSEHHLSLFISLMFEFKTNFYQDKKTASLFLEEENANELLFGQRALDRMVASYSPSDWAMLGI